MPLRGHVPGRDHSSVCKICIMTNTTNTTIKQAKHPPLSIASLIYSESSYANIMYLSIYFLSSSIDASIELSRKELDDWWVTV
jgi:hypothetical protein